MEKKSIGLILLIVIVIASVFVGLSSVLPTLDQTNLIIATLTNYFTMGTVLFVVALVRNILGYVTEYVKKNYKETYEDQKLYQTITYYLGLTTFLSVVPVVLLPDPIGTYIGGAIIVFMTIVDLGKQAVNMMFGK